MFAAERNGAMWAAAWGAWIGPIYPDSSGADFEHLLLLLGFSMLFLLHNGDLSFVLSSQFTLVSHTFIEHLLGSWPRGEALDGKHERHRSCETRVRDLSSGGSVSLSAKWGTDRLISGGAFSCLSAGRQSMADKWRSELLPACTLGPVLSLSSPLLSSSPLLASLSLPGLLIG